MSDRDGEHVLRAADRPAGEEGEGTDAIAALVGVARGLRARRDAGRTGPVEAGAMDGTPPMVLRAGAWWGGERHENRGDDHQWTSAHRGAQL